MARATSTPETEDQAAEATVELKPTDRVSIMFGLPFEMKQLLQKRADEAEVEGSEEKGVPLSEYIRDLLADHLEYTIPERTSKRTKKYASPEEKKAAQKARGKERRATIQAMLKLYKADPSLQARLAEQLSASQANGESEEEETEE